MKVLFVAPVCPYADLVTDLSPRTADVFIAAVVVVAPFEPGVRVFVSHRE